MIGATDRTGLEQVGVAGHGAHHPVVSGALPADTARNRRVEIVAYPLKYALVKRRLEGAC